MNVDKANSYKDPTELSPSMAIKHAIDVILMSEKDEAEREHLRVFLVRAANFAEFQFLQFTPPPGKPVLDFDQFTTRLSEFKTTLDAAKEQIRNISAARQLLDKLTALHPAYAVYLDQIVLD